MMVEKKPNGTIIAVANNKGEVGKTTAVVNLGTSLAIKGKKVLVIDNDSQANASAMLSLGVPMARKTLFEVFEGNIQPEKFLSDCCMPTRTGNLYLAPNSEKTHALELDLAAKFPASLHTLRNALGNIRDHFDVILIDCAPNLGLFTVNAFYACDFVIVPIDSQSPNSVRGLKNILKLIEETKQDGNSSIKFLRILITRVNKRKNICKQIISDSIEMFGEQHIFKTHIHIDKKIALAAHQQSVFSLSPTGSGAQHYRKLAVELIDMLNNHQLQLGHLVAAADEVRVQRQRQGTGTDHPDIHRRLGGTSG